jgi:GNAT superfamily N-acetyltransferase
MVELPCAEPTLRITLSDEADDDARRLIDRGVTEYDKAMSPQHREAAERPLDIMVRDEHGRVVGGLVAATVWDWLEVQDLWLAEPYRRGGLGRLLMAAAEEEARARGCRHSQLHTFSFQARDFYLKQGYIIIGQLDDYPPGETYYWLRKELA